MESDNHFHLISMSKKPRFFLLSYSLNKYILKYYSIKQIKKEKLSAILIL